MAVHCMPDHAHLFIGFTPDLALSDLVRDIKRATTLWMKEQQLVKPSFYWQEGFGAFSYSQSQINTIVQYVLNQEEHHRKRTFREEYIGFLQKFEVPYDEHYLFDFYDETADTKD